MYSLIPKLQSKHVEFLYRHIIAIFIFATLYYIAHYYLGEQGYQYMNPNKKYSFGDFIYFSLGTQSTIGFGDIYPTHSITKLITAAQLLSVAVFIMAAVL